MTTQTVRLSHGSGKGLQELLSTIIIPALIPGGAGVLEDAFVFDIPGRRLAFTTDSFVVSPLEFPGGNIGTLAACGTINDLSMMGARPMLLSVSLILEEGFAFEKLTRILTSLSEICTQMGIRIACGDTKVVDKGKADGLFINTSGIGIVTVGISLSAAYAKPGDAVIVSGGIGLHGVTILAQRENLHFASAAESDCAPLWPLAKAVLDAVPHTRVMRDATRGGLASVLHEIATDSKVSIVLMESEIPVPQVVKGACSFLGMDPLHIANEGRFAIIVPPEWADKAVAALRSFAIAKDACVIGQVVEKDRFPVLLKTSIGGTRPVEMPPGELLPRIC